ncbi:Mor-like transcription factor [Achromobacter phage Mano]|uniref:Mor-like transcription factor n=1 Tax=Achromobacter phage Mano TaxID=2767570 RepID=A0A7L8G6V1_9CAUD|nr:late transcriptional activator [Achromobacter phage Mano]QOE32792.1 Mor-like transcription factor [Achromobacter phage Mano]
MGQLPRCYPASRKAETVILYVPKTLKPDHQLVRILGWQDAHRLVQHFGGEILQPGNCRDVYRPWRDSSIMRLVEQGVPSKVAAEWFGVSDRHIKNLLRENPQEEPKAANDNNATTQTSAYMASSVK